ncbi:hypothetical protein [Paenibacillus lemnae]|uniref:Signal transduction histidine kinase n=1 Tax=Paenibacillus lemnae TaxID=1330551 RepID=A0A848M579_PAELE|nr:hypothetical protein [Paenibacillus lemnae]NMO95390.1 hypothetical protein [Paenibacillus lemnae]
MDYTNAVIFIILAFSLGAIMIMYKDRIPVSLRKGMAITSIAMVLFAFFLIVYSFFNLGSS